MSRDTFLKDEDGKVYSYDHMSTLNWLRGHTGGLDLCVGYLKKVAIELFMAGKDAEAVAIRKQAEQMDKDLRSKMVDKANAYGLENPESVGMTGSTGPS